MAKDSSFDCVSQVEVAECDNAVQQAKKELAQRYDLKGTDSEISFDKNKLEVTIDAPSDFVAGQIKDILNSKLVKRNIDLAAIKYNSPRAIGGGKSRIVATFVNGLDKEMASKINKDIKAQKFKVKTQIESDKIRVTSSSIDTLQEVIAFLKGQNYDVPLQFVNYR